MEEHGTRSKITKSAVDAVEPGARDTFLWDTALPGFGLKVTPGAAGRRICISTGSAVVPESGGA
jgi:hypothetical protein